MKRLSRAALVFFSDILMALLAWYGAFLLRFNFSVPADFLHTLHATMLPVVAGQAVVFRVFGLYQGIWRFASLPDLHRLVKAVAAAAIAAPFLIWLLRIPGVVPRSAFILDPLLLLLFMGGGRFGYRTWREHRQFGALRAMGKPVLLLGCGDAAAALLRELRHSSEWRVVGLLDDNPHKQGRTMYGHSVLGTLQDLERVAKAQRVGYAIIAMPSADHRLRRDMANLCVRAGLKALTVPSFSDLMSGRAAMKLLREVDVEDLLGRDPVSIDMPRLNGLLQGQVVMVTGAGGSIGSELCRQIARFRPARIVAFDCSEFFLYSLAEEFAQIFPEIEVDPVVGDVCDATRVSQVLGDLRPAIIFHAAAYKHVPLMEDRNAGEAVRNNVFGTLTVARQALAHGVARFVLVSTDKAVNPVNVMGATKRLAELLCQALQQTSTVTRFSMVRFGNVLGSHGSVIPKFQEQIARGGPVTVTHPDIIRYFMSIPEAAQLVLQAALMGDGGEIFVLDMGEPVRIADLARDMIRLSGASEADIRIEYTGLRAGEKLFEELLASDESTRPTHHAKLRIAKVRSVDDPLWLARLDRWLGAPLPLPPDQLRAELARWVPEYRPQNAARPANPGATPHPVVQAQP